MLKRERKVLIDVQNASIVCPPTPVIIPRIYPSPVTAFTLVSAPVVVTPRTENPPLATDVHEHPASPQHR